MRHLIIKRRNIRIIAAMAFLAVVIIITAPLAYEKVFIHGETVKVEQAIDDALNNLNLSRSVGFDKAMSLNADFFGNKEIISELKIDSLNLKGSLLSGRAFLKAKVLRDRDNNAIGLEGKLFSSKLALNSMVLPDFKTTFRLTKNELKIYSLNFAKAYNLRGRVSLKEPFETDLHFEIIRANIRDLAVIAKAKNPDVVLGVMNGFFSIKGRLDNLQSKGVLEGRAGKIGPIWYDRADIKLEGTGPIINVVDSRIRQGQATFTMEGFIDLRNIAGPNIFNGIMVRSDMKTIAWDGWDISKEGHDSLKMVKGIGDNVSVGFKTVARENLPAFQKKEYSDEMSLEYRMNLGQSFQMKLKENEEFFGIEHKKKF